MKRVFLFASVCASVFGGIGLSTANAADQAQSSAAPAVTEVVVTAERREQSVQKSSLAISVHSGDALVAAGVVQTRDITKLEPGVQIGQGGPMIQVYIRGVGDFGSTPPTNPAVAMNMDGVYISRGTSVEGNFFDLQRIEVLKGPQGTLYGRNASGGAINIISNPPKYGDLGGHLEAEVGNYGLVRTEGALNVPVSDTLAFRGAFQVVSRNGYSDQNFDDDHEQAVRLSMLWKPNDKLRLRVTADYEHIGGQGPAYVLKDTGANPILAAALQAQGVTIPNDPRMSITDPRATPIYNLSEQISAFGGCYPNNAIPAASATNSGTVPFPDQGFCPTGYGLPVAAPTAGAAYQNNKSANATVQLDYDFGPATLTILPAYRYVADQYVTYPIGVSAEGSPTKPEVSQSYSLEARLGHAGPKLIWVGGVYLYEELQDGPRQPPTDAGGESASNGPFISFDKIKTTTAAVFGQVTYSVTDQWRVIAGGRFASDFKSAYYDAYAFDSPLSLPYVAPGVLSPAAGACYLQASPCLIAGPWSGSMKRQSFHYKLGTEFDLTPQNMLYLTYATAEKAGGFNASGSPNCASCALPYNPEQLRALEVGSKNRFFDSKLQVNVEGFYWDYRNAQETLLYYNAAGLQFGTFNADKATSYGVDLSVQYRPTVDDTIDLSVEYLHAQIDKFSYQTFGLDQSSSGCSIATGTGGVQTIDCDGKPLPRAPRWSGTASYNHRFRLNGGAMIDANISGQFASSRYLDNDFTAQSRADAYFVGDLQLTYHSPDGKWQLAGYVRNFTNALVYTGGFSIPQGDFGLFAANLAPPRTYGARVSVDF